MSQENNTYQTFAELFRLISEFYKYPTEEFYQYINSKDIQSEFKELVEATALNYDIQIHTPFADFDEMKREYNRINIGAGHIPAPPIESLYKVWTTDETSGMGFASSKGYLMGDSAIHIQYLLEEYGLELPEEFAKKPDHLGVLLELLAFFIDNLEIDQVLSFVSDHFDWLDDYKDKLVEVKAHQFYQYVLELVVNLTADFTDIINKNLENKEV